MNALPITGGEVLLDSADMAWAQQYSWHLKRDAHTSYAWRNLPGGGKLLMHREILSRNGSDLDGMIVHHRNHDGLDNRRDNLVVMTRAENNQRRKRQCNNSSGYTGVSFDSWSGMWRASVCEGGKVRHLGRYDSIERAACAMRDYKRRVAIRELTGALPAPGAIRVGGGSA